MRTLLTTAAVAALVVIGFSPVVSAQAPVSPNANVTTYRIAVLDVTKVFKSHAKHTTEMDRLKTQSEGIKAQLEAKQKNITTKIQELREVYSPGTPDYKTREEEIQRLQADLQIEMNRHRKDFMEREAKIYYATYQDVSGAVQRYARYNHIGLVLRFNSEKVDEANNADILRGINQPVVFQHQIDITDDILKMVNNGAPRPGPNNVTPTNFNGGGGTQVPRSANGGRGPVQ